MFYVNSTLNPTFKMDGTAIIVAHPVTNIVNWNGSGGAASLVIENLPYYTNITAPTNAACAFWGRHIQDGQGNLSFSGMNARLLLSGDALFKSITAGTYRVLGARLSVGTGNIGLLQENTVGLEIDSSSGSDNTPVFLTNGVLNPDGVDFRAKSATINGGTRITSSSNLLQTTATSPRGGGCTPSGYITVFANGVALRLATCR